MTVRFLAPVRGDGPYHLVAAHLPQLAPVRSMIVTLEEDVL